MIRVAVTVLLAAALLALALPAIETARDDRAVTLARDELLDLRTSAERFYAANDPTPPDVPGASLLATVRVPADTVLGIGAGPRGQSLAWHRDDRSGRLETDLPFGSSLTLRESGSHRLRLTLVRTGNGVVLRIRRFKSGDATRPTRVRTRFGRLCV